MFRIQYKLSFYFKEKWFQVISVIKGKSFDSTLSLKQSKIHVNTFPTIKKIFRDLWYNASPQMTSLFRQSLFSQLYIRGALLRIFWKSTASPDPKTGEEEDLCKPRLRPKT